MQIIDLVKKFSSREKEITMQSGDRLALYTDGLVDVIAADGSGFGRSALQALFSSQAEGAPERICEQVLGVLETFRGDHEQYDDMALLVVGVE